MAWFYITLFFLSYGVFSFIGDIIELIGVE